MRRENTRDTTFCRDECLNTDDEGEEEREREGLSVTVSANSSNDLQMHSSA